MPNANSRTLSSAAAYGITPVVAAFRRRREGVESDVLRLGVDVRILETPGVLAHVAALRRLIRLVRPDLVHTVLFHSDVVGRLAASGTGARVLTSLVSTEGYRPGRDAAARARHHLANAADGWTARHLTAHFHANSQAVKAAAVSRLRVPASRITVIEGGRDAARLGERNPARRQLVRARLGLNNSNELLVTAGRQDEMKGHRFLIEAVAALAARRPGLHLVIAGRAGDCSTALAAMCAAMDVRQCVHLLGHRDDVPDILAAADAFVFPSIHEGLPGAVIEAMALALPIVASDIAPIRELVEHGKSALLVEPRSTAPLTAAIERLLAETETARALGARARAVFEERFSLERSITRRVALYHSLCAAS